MPVPTGLSLKTPTKKSTEIPGEGVMRENFTPDA
jgi:hypothetical protein